MPVMSLRRVPPSPRNTLPRKSKLNSHSQSTHSQSRGSATTTPDELDSITPHAESVSDVNLVGADAEGQMNGIGDVNTPTDPLRECTSMTSSLHRERDEEADELAELPATSTLPRSRVFASHVKAKRLRFYRNGDQYYKGFQYALRPDRVKAMQPLLEDLTRSLCDSVALPLGVRHIFTLDGQARIMNVDEFVDGESYVCSSHDTFKSIDYENAREPLWSLAGARPRRIIGEQSILRTDSGKNLEPNSFVYPRIITVIRNGVKPRRVVRHLLNKKSARSFEQVMADLTVIVKLDSGVIKKLFAIGGAQVTSLVDFFVEDDVFIAYGNERTTADDFLVSMEEDRRLPRRGYRPRRRVLPPRNESLQSDRRGSVLPDDVARRLPIELDGKMRVVRFLGDGNTAHVYEIEDRETKELRALKIISRDNVLGREDMIQNEIDIMLKVDHEKIVKLFDVWPIDGAKYLSMELITGGDLFEYMSEARPITERNAAKMIGSLASALDYLHGNNIAHRDVKLENLLLVFGDDDELDLKLADFGLAAEMPEDGGLLYVCCGTPTYVAPEVLTNEGYGLKVDVWSMGVILYVMLAGFPPFQSNDGDQEELFRQILQARLHFPSPMFDSVSWAAKSLIMCTVNIDSNHRLAATDVLDNQWIQSLGTADPEYEVMAQIAVENGLSKYEDDEVEQLEESQCEFFYSRRTSMDEMSTCGDFEFSRQYSGAGEV